MLDVPLEEVASGHSVTSPPLSSSGVTTASSNVYNNPRSEGPSSLPSQHSRSNSTSSLSPVIPTSQEALVHSGSSLPPPSQESVVSVSSGPPSHPGMSLQQNPINLFI